VKKSENSTPKELPGDRVPMKEYQKDDISTPKDSPWRKEFKEHRSRLRCI
jgi:hypothetical protein